MSNENSYHFDPDHFNYFNSINRFKLSYTDQDFAQGQIWYIFMTSPFCNFSNDNKENSQFIEQLVHTPHGMDIIKALSFGSNGNEVFMKLLTNCVESFTPSDISSSVYQFGETISKLKHVTMGSDNDSRSAGTFNIPYHEKEHIPVTRLHKAWYEYAQNVRKGKFKTSEEFIKNRLIDYQSSLYYFLLAPDGESLVYWAKYTGVMPTGLPYSTFEGKTGNNGELLKVNIPYSYVYKEDLEPEILNDFNAVARPDGTAINSNGWKDASKSITSGFDSVQKIWSNPTSFFNKYIPSENLESWSNVHTSGKADTRMKSGVGVGINHNSMTFNSSGVSIQWKMGGNNPGRASVPILVFDNDSGSGIVDQSKDSDIFVSKSGNSKSASQSNPSYLENLY